LRDIPSIVIAKMDGTKNEHSLLKIEGFPTILFFPAGEKSKKPLAVDTERNATAFLKYIKKNAGIPFTAPEIPEVNFEDGLDLDSVNEADQEIEPDQHIKDEL
jgi:protein disulfide-isomerase A1